MLPGPSKLSLRLSCKQLKWEIDNLLGLNIGMSVKDLSEMNCENLGGTAWTKQILIRKLTINNNLFENFQVHAAWTSVLKNARFNNLNRLSSLSLSNLKIQDEGELASIFIAVSSINSLREFSLHLVVDIEENNSKSLIPAPIENHYNFPNLTTFKLNYTHLGNNCQYLKCFQQMCCPQLKCLSVGFNPEEHYHDTLQYLIWHLELLVKFGSSLKNLTILEVSLRNPRHPNRFWEMNAPNEDEKAFRIGSQLKNLKELDIVFTGHLCRGEKEIYRSAPVSGWLNLFYGMRTSLEKLIRDGSFKFCSRYEFLTKDSHPNLKFLSVVWDYNQLDWTMITQISDQLETLELWAIGPCNKGVKNFDQIPLSLKKIVFFQLVSTLGVWAFFRKLISIRESLVVQYDELMNIQLAEYLGDRLTRPNFIWRGIEYENREEEWRVTALCRKFGIPCEKFFRKENE